MSLRSPISKIAVFGTFLVLGLWMAYSIHDPFQDSGKRIPQFSIDNSPHEQYRLLLIVVDKVTKKPNLQSAWWIGTRDEIPTAMVSIYPNITQQAFRNAELSQAFSLPGIWISRKLSKKFLNLLAEWDIHWNDYLIIDLAVQSAIIDQLGGVTINGVQLSGIDVNQQVKKISTSEEQLIFQSRLWSALCSRVSQQTEVLDLGSLPLNLKNHVLTSLETKNEHPIGLFPAKPMFPVCMVNAGLMEAAIPPFVPTK